MPVEPSKAILNIARKKCETLMEYMLLSARGVYYHEVDAITYARTDVSDIVYFNFSSYP